MLTINYTHIRTYTNISRCSYIDIFRLSVTAFIRNRTHSFPTLILYLLNLRQHSNQTELDQFFKLINKEKEASQVVTKSAFFQARKQLSYKAFIVLLNFPLLYAYH
jgi:hypothetical protein